MTRSTQLLTLTLLLSGVGGAAVDLLTGRNWIRLSASEKIIWISGYSEARLLWEAEVRTKTPGCGDDAAIRRGSPCLNSDGTRSRAFYFPTSLTLAEIAESLDQLYSEPTNRVIPVTDGFGWVYVKSQGASEAALREWESTMRACIADRSTCPGK